MGGAVPRLFYWESRVVPTLSLNLGLMQGEALQFQIALTISEGMNILSGTSIQLRGGNNRCISVSCTGEDDTFFATVDGRCIGEETECFNLKNRHVEPGAVNLEDIKIRYGDKVVVKAPAARDKYLGAPRIGTGTSGSNARRKCLKFTRSGIAGLNCDDWEIIPAEMPRTHIAALNIATRSPNASLINESEAIDNNIG